MFSTEKIWHTSIIVPKNSIEDLILKLHEKGICQLKEAETDLGFKNFRKAENEKIADLQKRIFFVKEQFSEFEVMPATNLIKELFFPKPPEKIKVNLMSDKEIISEIENMLNDVEPKLKKILQRKKELEEEAEKKLFLLNNLSYFPNLKLDFFRDTTHLKIVNGLILTEKAKELVKELKDKCCFFFNPIDDRLFISIIMLKKDFVYVENVLHRVGFEELKINFEAKTPLELAEEIAEEVKKINNELSQLKKYLYELYKKYNLKIDRLQEELNVLKERAEAFNLISNSDSFSLLEVWLPEKNTEEFKRLIKEFKCYCIFAEREDAPTILQNPKLIKPFEIITGLYSLPKYKRLDPTPVLALSYALFFGFMLTDAIYGLALALIGLLLMYGIGKYNKDIKNFGNLILFLGISTALLGIVFGSYCGDILQKLGIKVPMVLDPMKDVMAVIGISFAMAFLHQLTGLALGLYENLRFGKILDATSEQLTRLCFLLGAAIAFLFKPIAIIGILLVVVSAIVHIIANGIKNNIAMGMLSIFDFSGLVGDLCSYSRLAALAVGTAGIALAVNFMALLVNKMIPVVGIVAALIVFTIGHLFNMAMNGLGAFIHSVRLHFLEFFQKFYEGGGYAYSAFAAKRKKYITEVE